MQIGTNIEAVIPRSDHGVVEQETRRTRKLEKAALIACVGLVAFSPSSSAQVTRRVSVDTGGGQGNHHSEFAAISADGRFVAFESAASNLVGGDTNGTYDIFVHDRHTGTTERASLATGGGQANGYSRLPSISGDGRYVAFYSEATNLVAGDTNGFDDVFVRDRQLGTTERVSVSTSGTQGNEYSAYPSISADGRFVLFEGFATNLVPGDGNGATDLFVRDRQLGSTERVSVATGGVEGNSASFGNTIGRISADGRFVVFDSLATNMVAGDTNGQGDVFVHDRQLGITERVSVATGGAQANAFCGYPSISADGRFVSFYAAATNLVSGDTNGFLDTFVRDRQLGTTERVSVAVGGTQGNADSAYSVISNDGRIVVFQSSASNFVGGDTNAASDIFARDRLAGTTERLSVSSGGVAGNAQSVWPSMSGDGRFVVFWSGASTLVAGDTNAFDDVFVRDRVASGFTTLCHPGVGGVVACPCSNPPGVTNLGCNNSAATGGAILGATGAAYLSMDSLSFITQGERPTATSILLQGNALISGGAAYGQGVRCVGGALKRLYVKSAVGGSITAPAPLMGDPTVSARSAALGDVIQPGTSRWYLVYYRDPIVLGGCTGSFTFNATQSGQVAWSL
jgi:Tol biopolymer transport system component